MDNEHFRELFILLFAEHFDTQIESLNFFGKKGGISLVYYKGFNTKGDIFLGYFSLTDPVSGPIETIVIVLNGQRSEFKYYLESDTHFVRV